MQKPVDVSIGEARKSVFYELEGKKCHDKLYERYVEAFKEIYDKTSRCNNVATLQTITIEVDALKVRCLNEVATEEAKLTRVIEEPDKAESDSANKPIVVTPVKKTKTVSIKTINNSTTWQIETADDVKRYVNELEKKLMASLEDDTVLNVEF